jgi:hypothetical protein
MYGPRSSTAPAEVDVGVHSSVHAAAARQVDGLDPQLHGSVRLHGTIMRAAAEPRRLLSP